MVAKKDAGKSLRLDWETIDFVTHWEDKSFYTIRKNAPGSPCMRGFDLTHNLPSIGPYHLKGYKSMILWAHKEVKYTLLLTQFKN